MRITSSRPYLAIYVSKNKTKLNIKIYSDKPEDNAFLVRNTFNKKILLKCLFIKRARKPLCHRVEFCMNTWPNVSCISKTKNKVF